MANLPYSQQTINTVLSLVPIDDVTFQKICEDINVCQELISTILGEPVTVISVTPQDSIMNLQGRSVNQGTFNYEKFPFFSQRKNHFINTPEGVKILCEKVENAFQAILLEKLFSYVQKGGMVLAFAANEANLSIEEFKAKMQEAGYIVPATKANEKPL